MSLLICVLQPHTKKFLLSKGKHVKETILWNDRVLQNILVTIASISIAYFYECLLKKKWYILKYCSVEINVTVKFKSICFLVKGNSFKATYCGMLYHYFVAAVIFLENYFKFAADLCVHVSRG